MKVRVRQVIRAFANPVAKYVYRCSYRWPRVSQVPFLQSLYVGLQTLAKGDGQIILKVQF